MSKEMDRVGLETTIFGFPCLRSYKLTYLSDNVTEVFEIVHTINIVHFYSLYSGIPTKIELLDYTYLFL